MIELLDDKDYCNGCEEHHCQEWDTCFNCDKQFCESHFGDMCLTCDGCNRIVCNDCSNDCSNDCNGCDNYYCKECERLDDGDDRCKHCWENGWVFN